MGKIVLVFSFFIAVCFLSSCGSDGDSGEQRADAFLAPYKKEIDKYLDSANYYCDILFLQYRAGTKKETLISEYASRVKYYESHINSALDEANLITKAKQLMPGVYERWLDGFDLKRLADKNKKLMAIGIDLRAVPADGGAVTASTSQVVSSTLPLEQEYFSPKGNFSIRLPKNWQVTEKSEEGATVIMASGAGNAANNGMMRDGALEISIIDFDKDFSTYDFYNGNIASVKMHSKDFTMMQEGDIDINGIKSKCAIFSCNYNGIVATSVQAYFFANRKGYIINGTSAGNNVNDYKTLYLSIIKTFRMKG